ncbi:Rossmann-fold NAD(P)-binding domain-containing protein [Rhizobium laguerreae]|uniref:hypothetical protein n=1 Tax=Rhizobium laguerreae TaxID=1076926 RepID=UPI001C908800|nr:hypothetical protein [Rhizobium laguerreae]MBY3122488.1 hypothetical protein [Rhizobium laguerreae]
MRELYGFYIDHKMTQPSAMALHSAKIKPLARELAENGVLLVCTCARIEIYGEKFALTNIVETIFSGFCYKHVEGAVAIIKRIAEIAASAHSQILGESNISNQLEDAIQSVNQKLAIFYIARFAIDIGRAARDRMQFTASFNYNEIVREIVADRFPNDENLDSLYIIGSGMLGRELIGSDVRERFKGTVMVTRNPKNLRKRLRLSTDAGLTFMRPADIGLTFEPRSIVVIATSDVDGEYEANIRNAVLRLKPRVIVDLSSVPVLTEAGVGELDYVSIYGEEFLRFIVENNKHLAPKLPLLFADIEETIQTAHMYLCSEVS